MHVTRRTTVRLFATSVAVPAYATQRNGGAITTFSATETEPPPQPPPIAELPGILIQSLIIPAAKTSEGLLIRAVDISWFEIINYIIKDPKTAYQIPYEKWEEIIAGAYKESGFDEVILTPRSRDHGRDVIATKYGIGEVRVIDQVKAFRPPHLVGYNDVRALMGVLPNDGASKAFLTTTSDFAPNLTSDPLIAPYIPSRLELVNGPKLFARLKKIADEE